MAKAKSKKKSKKRTITCGVCQATGHNARTCPSRTGPVKEEVAASSEPEAAPPPPPQPKKTKIDMGEDDERRRNTVPRREAPTADTGTAATAAPYQCPKCNSVAVLVAVKVKDQEQTSKKQYDVFKSDTRCEKCMNKPTPSDLILKWGVRPGEEVPVPDA